MIIKLYGVISPIYEDNKLVFAEPIFANAEDTKELYRIRKNGTVEKIDIKKLEEPVFLPVSKKKIDDGRRYLIVFRMNQDDTSYSKKQYFIVPSYKLNEKDKKVSDFKRIFVGIKFPDRFVCAIDETMTLERLQTYLSGD